MRVTIERLTKRFGRVTAVEDLSLEINDGEFVALLGPSGCGKTTVLLTVAGIYKPTAGWVRFNDQVVNDLAPKDRNIGMVFQSYALYPHMSVYDNIAFPLTLRRMSREEIRKRVMKVAQLLHIEDLLDRRPGQLSGGQQQRVALCRALVKEPDLLLLDEPLSNLDAKLRLMARAEIKRLQKELGITTIFVTHDQVEAMTMADRIAILNHGRLQQFDTPDALYRYPANLFVAEFIGSPPMNFLEGQIRAEDHTFYFVGDGWRVELPSSLRPQIHASSHVSILGVRPEHVQVVPPGEGDLQAEVYVIEPLGRDVLVNLRLKALPIRALASPPFPWKVGAMVGLRLDRSHLYLFDKHTGALVGRS
ncbi:MAG: ABC transporter ATP-binding protein [Thermoflexus sp.]